jgi:hypothetical protein
VPASAAWIEGTYIDCSLATQSDTNFCTVYQDETGEILADAVFVLNATRRAAALSDLSYLGFSHHRIIYLTNGLELVPRSALEATERDPTNRVIRERLTNFIGPEKTRVIDCGKTADAASQCALKALAERRPFYVRYYRAREDSIRFQGFAGDADGNVQEVDYDDEGWESVPLPPEAQLLDGGLTVVLPCPKPIRLEKTANRLTCDGSSAERTARAGGINTSVSVLSVEELLSKRWLYAHSLVTVRGCYSEYFEYSGLASCSSRKDESAEPEQSMWAEAWDAAVQYARRFLFPHREVPNWHPKARSFQSNDIWVESPVYEWQNAAAFRGVRGKLLVSETPLVSNFRDAEDLQASKKLHTGEIVLVGQFETNDWRDEPGGGGFGHLGAYSSELILANVVNSTAK